MIAVIIAGAAAGAVLLVRFLRRLNRRVQELELWCGNLSATCADIDGGCFE